MKITAVIPIRVGSQRVKNKNLRKFGDTTLMELKINNLLKVPEFNKIIVNTNSEDAIQIVKSHPAYQGGAGKLSFHRREEYYASSQCSGSEVLKHLGEVTDTDVFVYCPCTSPFVKPETYTKCVKEFISSQDCDSVASVSLVKEFLWLDGKPLNYDPFNAPNSQDLPNVVALNFGVAVVGREDLINNRNIIGKRPKFVVTSDVEATDIDTPLDFFIAEQLYIKTVVEKKDVLE